MDSAMSNDSASLNWAITPISNSNCFQDIEFRNMNSFLDKAKQIKQYIFSWKTTTVVYNIYTYYTIIYTIIYTKISLYLNIYWYFCCYVYSHSFVILVCIQYSYYGCYSVFCLVCFYQDVYVFFIGFNVSFEEHFAYCIKIVWTEFVKRRLFVAFGHAFSMHFT